MHRPFLKSPLLLAGIAVCLACLPASAQVRRLDLAGPAVAERPVSPGATIVLEFVNIVPRMRGSYTVTVRQEVIPVEMLDFPADRAGDGAQKWLFLDRDEPDPCKGMLQETAGLLDTATTEPSVSRIVATARRDVSPDCAARLNGFIREMTTLAVEDTFVLRPNQHLVVHVSRPGDERAAEWRYVLATEPRGEWRTGYGFTFVPRVYPQYYTEQMEDDPEKFVITREGTSRRRDGLTNYDFIPSILFSWLPGEARYRNWSGGITAGLGYDLDEVALFGGLSATYNENVTFSAGLAIHEQPRLGPQFRVGEVLKEDLDAEALHVNRFGPNLFFGISLRFGQNPFGRLGGDGGEDEREEDGGAGGGETRPETGSEAPANESAPLGGGEGPEPEDLQFTTLFGAVGDTVGTFVVESMDVAAQAETVVFKLAGTEPLEVSGTYAPADGTHCITLSAQAKSALPWVGEQPEILCLTVPQDKLAAVEAAGPGNEISVTITGFRVRWNPETEEAAYDAAPVAAVTKPAQDP